MSADNKTASVEKSKPRWGFRRFAGLSLLLLSGGAVLSLLVLTAAVVSPIAVLAWFTTRKRKGVKKEGRTGVKATGGFPVSVPTDLWGLFRRRQKSEVDLN